MIGAHCGTLYAEHGVELRTGVSVAGITRDDAGGGLQVDLAGGEAVPADVVVVGIGVVPNTEWLEGSDLMLQNGIVCDDKLFAAEGIVAAGDIARWSWHHDGAEELIRIEHWEVAAGMGRAAALGLLAGRHDAPSFTPVPYFWSDQFGIRFQVLGNPGGDDEVVITQGSFDDGKFLALFGRAGRLRAVMGIGRPRQLMGFRPLLQSGCNWDDALAHAVA
jgi:NADPH-dependent 2,4-dienoyl-CoA reductase/sulfur reductase-like enzyme